MSNKPKFFWGKHKRMWDILARTGVPIKDLAFSVMNEDKIPMNGCYACEARTSQQKIYFCASGSCPLNWGIDETYACERGLYREWVNAKAIRKRMRLAASIRDLPLSENAREMYEVIDD